MDTGKWTQEIGVTKSMSEIAQSACSRSAPERKARPQKDHALNCPRCNSTNTKFCYYNNYSLTQPRYFCKTCRRYWTEGGTLRNVPVGGGSRKNKKPSSSSLTTLVAHDHATTQKFPDLNPPSISQFSSENPKTTQHGHDLNLAFPALQGFHGRVPQFLELGKVENSHTSQLINSSPSSTPPSTSFSTLELLKTAGITSRGLNSFISTPISHDFNGLYASGFPFQETKPSLNFSAESLGGRYIPIRKTDSTGDDRFGEGPNGVQAENLGKLLFPFGAMKQHSSTINDVDDDQSKGQGSSTGYWNGMLGGGGSW